MDCSKIAFFGKPHGAEQYVQLLFSWMAIVFFQSVPQRQFQPSVTALSLLGVMWYTINARYG